MFIKEVGKGCDLDVIIKKKKTYCEIIVKYNVKSK